MREVQLRVPLGLGKHLHDTVFAPGSRESVAFCLVSHVDIGSQTVLLVRHVMTLDDSAYFDDASRGAAWRGSAMIPVIEAAISEDLGIVLVHAHDFGGAPHLSSADRESAARLLPMFQRRVPQRPHGSLVLSRGNAGGVLALPGERPSKVNASVRWMGTSIIDWPGIGEPELAGAEVFDRQGLVVGAQSLLTAARVVVVGLCGGGSHVVQQLAHMGVGTVVGVDADVGEDTNRHRSVGMTPADAKQKVKKTEVMKRLVRTIGNGTTFVGIDARVPEPVTLDALKAADIIIGCVDNLHARAFLQEIAWRYVIPYVDVGANVRGLKGNVESPRVSVGGNVHVFIPGGFCGWCCGFISDAKLNEERGGQRDPSYFQNKKGEAQVVSFNGFVASAAVTEALQLLTAFRGASLDPKNLLLPDGRQRGCFKFDGGRGTLEDWGAKRRVGCTCCNDFVGSGQIIWKASA